MTVLLVEQNFPASRPASRIATMSWRQRRIIDMIPRAEIESSLARLEAYLGV